MRAPEKDTTEILRSLAQGDRQVADELFARLYAELKKLASGALRGGGQRSLDTTEVVHEAYLRLVDQTRAKWQDRAHFCAVAAQVMRRILIDHARRRRRVKRGGGHRPLSLVNIDVPALSTDADSLLSIDEALTRLSRLDGRQARVVELRYFGGLSVDETATVLEVSPRTVKGDWRVARAWLKDFLSSTSAS